MRKFINWLWFIVIVSPVTLAQTGFELIRYDYGILLNQSKCVDTLNNNLQNGAPLVLWDCQGATSQQWRYDDLSQTLRNRAGKCVSVQGGKTGNGTPLVLADCHGGNSQMWSYSGAQSSILGMAGKCIDADQASNKNGTRLVLSSCHGGVNQQFIIRPLTDNPAVKGEVCLYTDPNYLGLERCFRSSQPDLRLMGIDNAVSSLKVSGEITAQLYDGINFQGQVFTYVQNTAWVGNLADNKFSALKLEAGKVVNPVVPIVPVVPVEPIPEVIDGRMQKEFFRLTSRGRCLDIHRGDFDAQRLSGKVQIWKCTNEINQDWKLQSGQLVTRHGFCLEVQAQQIDRNGGLVQVSNCVGGSNQQWYFDRQKRLRNRANDKCLDIDSATMDVNGGKVQLWACHDRNNQQWLPMYHPTSVVPPVNPPVKTVEEERMTRDFFQLSNRDKCLDVHRGDFDARLNGGRVQIWQCLGASNQMWKLDQGRLMARNGLCLDVQNVQQNGAKVQLWLCHQEDNQKWYLDAQKRWHNRAVPNKCLDIDSGTMNQNGGRVQLWDCHDRINQQWTVRY